MNIACMYDCCFDYIVSTFVDQLVLGSFRVHGTLIELGALDEEPMFEEF